MKYFHIHIKANNKFIGRLNMNTMWLILFNILTFSNTFGQSIESEKDTYEAIQELGAFQAFMGNVSREMQSWYFVQSCGNCGAKTNTKKNVLINYPLYKNKILKIFSSSAKNQINKVFESSDSLIMIYKIIIIELDSFASYENPAAIEKSAMAFDPVLGLRQKLDKHISIILNELQIKHATESANKETRRKIINLGLIFLSILFLLLIVFFSFILKSKKKLQMQNEKIILQNKVIEEKNTEITDSINYAQRIQHAKLPKKDEIYNTLKQSFVLFKPKDIVSGDFYFFQKRNNLILIASADCTGHGVPGALMSMIGSEQLNLAVSKSANTSDILSLLNLGIKTSLQQSSSDESTRDGMDIALCSIDLLTREVKYSGANRPMWLVRKGQLELEEIKATKKAIGGLTEDDQHFDTHELKMSEGDTFYLSTDGYADTFSGQTNKKLTTKKFKQLLLEIQNKSMQEQETYLDNSIDEWKTGTEQVDDILVIGIRL